MSAPEEPIGRIDVVKTLTGNRGPRSGFSDQMYTDIIGRWTSMLRTMTKKYDWVPADPDYNTVRGIIERFAAAEIKWMINKQDITASAFYKSAQSDLEMLLEHSAVAGKPESNGINIAQPHGSFPASPTGSYFTGLRKRHPGTNVLVNSELSIFYPWRF